MNVISYIGHFTYRAFDVHKRKYLSSKDVLLGLAAMEPTTQHGGMPAEMRCRYIFRSWTDKNHNYITVQAKVSALLPNRSDEFFASIFGESGWR